MSGDQKQVYEMKVDINIHRKLQETNEEITKIFAIFDEKSHIPFTEFTSRTAYL